MPKNM